MIEFAKITGEVENNLIQVQMRTEECLFVPIVTMGTDVSLPSEDWITANKDNFLALVTYEGETYYNPMLIGFYPVKGADSSKGNTHEMMIALFEKLLDQLLKAKVNTQIGPQPFMPDTIQKFNDFKKELEDIKKLILPLKL